MTELDLKDAYLSVAAHPDFKSICALFGKIRPSSSRLFPSVLAPHKIAKASSGLSGEKRYSRGDLSGRYPYNRIERERITPVHRNDDYSTQIRRLYNQQGQVDLNPTQEITFLGFTINSVKMTLNLPHDKETNIRSHCRQMLA